MGERDGKVCFYCSHCGMQSFREIACKDENGKCYYCHSEIKEYDLIYFLERYKVDKLSDLKENIKTQIRQMLYKDFIMNQPEFDMDLLKKRTKEEGDDDLEIIYDKNNPLITVECPYCHCNDTKKIKTTGRVFSTGLFGFGSGKIGKQWHCNTCKSDF